MPRPPVVVVIFDELPAMSLMDAKMDVDAARLPNFAALAASSTWYRSATTVADATFVAVPSILGGNRPSTKFPRKTFSHSIFTVTPGYDRQVEEPLTHVCRGDCHGQDLTWQPFDGHPIADLSGNAERIRRGRAVVRSISASGDRPGLWLVHYLMPHVPWRFLPNGAQYLTGGPQVPGLGADQVWGRDPFLIRQGFQRHLLQLGFADGLLGELVTRMKDAGIWDSALLIVTADHGQSSRPGGERRPVTTANFPGVANVPLFVKLPGQATGAIDDEPRETIDVVPTIASVLGTGRRRDFDGIAVDRPKPADFEPGVRNGRLASVVRMGFKDFLAARARQLKAQLQRFPPGDAQGVWHIGPDDRFVGRRVVTLPRTLTPGTGSIDNPGSYARVHVSATGISPSYVSGSLDGVLPGKAIAIAVNGRIASTARSYVAGGAVRFSSLVPPASFRVGGNAVQVYTIDGPRLRLVAQTG